MKRSVLLIGSPLSGDNFLKGVDVDITNFYRYVTSSIGGAYLEEEIIYLKHPKVSDVKYALSRIRNSDIATIYFSGHGARAGNKDFICLNHKEYFPVTSLITNSKRHLIFIDACRTPMDSFIGDVMVGAGYDFSMENPGLARRLHCQYIQEAALGGAVVFGTAANQPSYDSESGGIYTNSLMATLYNWSNKHMQKMITVRSAFHNSSIITQRREPTQVPKLYCHKSYAALNIPIGINPKAHVIQKRSNNVKPEELLRLLRY